MGVLSLVFETKESNSAFVNEAMLLAYLSKCLTLPKEKLRILSKETFVSDSAEEAKPMIHGRVEPEMTKITVEIMQDHDAIERHILKVKTEVRDGSSLLYDLSPSYLGIKYGHSGLMTRSRLSEMTLILKQGRHICD